MERQLTSEEIKKIELEILVEFSNFCKQNNLRFYLAYGTLLGAVRHKGFIPWDDDCDICMMREDYEKFSKYANELPSNLFLQTNETDSNYSKKIIKIRMNNTKLVESDESENEKYHQGISRCQGSE